MRPARRVLMNGWLATMALCALLLSSGLAAAQTDPLASWNDGPAN